MEAQTEPISSDFESSDITESDIVSPRGEREEDDESEEEGSFSNNNATSTFNKDDDEDNEEERNDDNKEDDRERPSAREQTKSPPIPQTEAINKLKSLLEALAAKEAEVKKKEADHLAKAQGLLVDMNKTGTK